MRSSVMGGEKNYYVTAFAANFFNLILLCQRALARLTLGVDISNSRAELKGRFSENDGTFFFWPPASRIFSESIWEWRQLGVCAQQQIQFDQLCHSCCCLLSLNFGGESFDLSLIASFVLIEKRPLVDYLFNVNLTWHQSCIRNHLVAKSLWPLMVPSYI